MRPADREASRRRAKAASEDVIERIEIVTPVSPGDKDAAHLRKEVFKGREAAAIHFVDGLITCLHNY
jgi:hypothetical protein